jgi:PAS domain S-box-containing protein
MTTTNLGSGHHKVSLGSEPDINPLCSDEIHRSLVDECPFGIYRLNLNTSCIERANPALLRMLGYTLEEMCSRPIPNLYENPSDRDRYLATLNESGSVRDFETHFRDRNGKILRVSLSGYLSEDTSGQQFVQGYVLDITRQRELEEQLSHSRRMEAVGRLAGGVAHDFNNITQSISLSCELALQSPLAPELESKLLDIMRQTSRAAEITRQLLAFSCRQVLQPRVVDVNDCLRRALALVTRTVGLDVSVRLKLDETADHVFIDPEQLTLVLMHMADNAREAMPRGGVLSISTDTAPGNSDPSHGAISEPCTVLTISDTGTGMDEMTLRHIFEPFFSTKETTVTTGLGLSTVHGIIAQSNGRIECSSSPGDGATFRIYLPVAHSLSTATAKPPANHRAIGILLAEDDPIVNKHLSHALKQAGFFVRSTSNGQEALDVFDPQRHQVLVTDIVMPKLDGMSLTRKLCENFPELPVVLISGFSEEASVLQNLPQGHLCYVQKPFPVSRLVKAIRDVLKQSTLEHNAT